MRAAIGYAATSCFLLLMIVAKASGQEVVRPGPNLDPVKPMPTVPADVLRPSGADTGIINTAPQAPDLNKQPDLVRQSSTVIALPPRLNVEQECLAVEQQCNSVCPVNSFLKSTEAADARIEYSNCLGRECHVTGLTHCKEALGKALLEAWHERHKK